SDLSSFGVELRGNMRYNIIVYIARRGSRRYISADAEIRYDFARGEISIYSDPPSADPNSIRLRLCRKRKTLPGSAL
ncbi:MAG: hypothetical protein IJR90_08405, partial [Clostridia bacterium]|nr:hypothetical protein [Clostridia bacterium]